MTIEAGALSLRITEVGGEQVLKTLTDIDKKAAALGTATQSVKFNVPGATQVNGQLQQIGANFNTVTRAATAAAPALEKQAAAQLAVAKTAAAVGAETAGLSRAASMFTGLTAQLGALGLVVSAGAIVSGVVSLTRDAIDAGDALHDLAMRTGLSVETLSILGPVAAKSGASTEVLTVAFRNLSKEVEKAKAGNKDAVETFTDLGISVKDLEGLSLDQVLIRIADAQERMANGSRKTADMVKLFGRAGDQLIPTLHELADGGFERARERAEALGGVMSTDFADKADEFNDQLEDMHTAVGGLGRAIAEPLLPQMTRLAEMLTTLVAGGRGFIGILVEAAEKAGLLMLLGPGGPALLGAGAKGTADHVVPGSLTFQQTTGLMTPPVATAVRKATAEELAAERERRAALQKARDIDRATLGQIGLLYTGPAGPTVAPSVGLDGKGKMKGEKAFGLADVIDKEFDALEEKMKARIERLQGVVGTIAQSVGGAFGDAFSAAFKGGDFFAEFGKSMLSSLGNVVMQLGEQLLAYGLVIAPLAALLAFTPFGGLGLGAGASIAAGLALTAIGAAMGAAGGGGGKGGGGGAGGSTKPQEPSAFAVAFDPDGKLRKQSSAVAPSTRSINGASLPDKQPTFVFAPTIIGKDDAKAQKDLAYMVERVVSNGGARGIRGG